MRTTSGFPTKPAKSAPWGEAQILGPVINSPGNDSGPNFSPDDHRMFFASPRSAGAGQSWSEREHAGTGRGCVLFRRPDIRSIEAVLYRLQPPRWHLAIGTFFRAPRRRLAIDPVARAGTILTSASDSRDRSVVVPDLGRRKRDILFTRRPGA